MTDKLMAQTALGKFLKMVEPLIPLRDELERVGSLELAAQEAKDAAAKAQAEAEAIRAGLMADRDAFAAEKAAAKAEAEGIVAKAQATLNAAKAQAEALLQTASDDVAKGKAEADAELSSVKALTAKARDRLKDADKLATDAEARKAKAEADFAALRAKLG